MQVCKECGVEKPWNEDNFYKDKRRAHRYRTCKVCWHKKCRKWAEEHPERTKQMSTRSALRIRYGITPEEKQTKFEAQGSCCAICKTRDPGKRDWVIDHDHVTGKNRGVLCDHCNKGIGHFYESMEALREAANYIEKYKTEGGQP